MVRTYGVQYDVGLIHVDKLPVVVVLAVQSVVTVVARLGQRDAARGTRDALFVPAARTHSHQEPVHDLRSAAFATRRTITVAVC